MEGIDSIDKMHLTFTMCGGRRVTANSVRDTSKHILEHPFKFAVFLILKTDYLWQLLPQGLCGAVVFID